MCELCETGEPLTPYWHADNLQLQRQRDIPPIKAIYPFFHAQNHSADNFTGKIIRRKTERYFAFAVQHTGASKLGLNA